MALYIVIQKSENFLDEKNNIEILNSFKGALSGLRQFFGNWKPLKNDEKCFLFHLKISFRSHDI